MPNDANASAREQLIQHLLTHSVQRGNFTLKSGKQSDWFLDAKQTACDPEAIRWIAQLMIAQLPAETTTIGGLTVGSDPVAYGVAARSVELDHPLRSFTVRKEAKGHGMGGRIDHPLRSFTVRKEAKGHGMGGRIAGALRPGDSVVITEDAVTRGTSLMEAVEVVTEFGATVVMVAPLVDRGGTCEAMVAPLGIPYLPLVTAPDLGFEFEGAIG